MQNKIIHTKLSNYRFPTRQEVAEMSKAGQQAFTESLFDLSESAQIAFMEQRGREDQAAGKSPMTCTTSGPEVTKLVFQAQVAPVSADPGSRILSLEELMDTEKIPSPTPFPLLDDAIDNAAAMGPPERLAFEITRRKYDAPTPENIQFILDLINQVSAEELNSPCSDNVVTPLYELVQLAYAFREFPEARLQIMKALLNAGANPNLKASPLSGVLDTPLIRAIICGDYEAAKILLEYSANPDLPDERGLTPLMYATDTDHLRMVKLLVYWKAKLNLKDKVYGVTALDMARLVRSPRVRVLDYLQSRGAKSSGPIAAGKVLLFKYISRILYPIVCFKALVLDPIRYIRSMPKALPDWQRRYLYTPLVLIRHPSRFLNLKQTVSYIWDISNERDRQHRA